MKTEKEIIAQLHTLQSSIVPSEKLHKRIVLLGQHLPDHTPGGVPFGMFRPALALAVFLLLVTGVSSGIVLSANKSQPGSFLYPVKKAVIQTQIHFTQSPIEKQRLQEEILEVTPTASPTPTIAPTKTPEKEHEKKDVEGAHMWKMQISLTPVPQGNLENHGNSHGEDNTQNFQNLFNRHEDDNKEGSLFLTNHEF